MKRPYAGLPKAHEESLREAKKYQNLRQDTLQQIRVIQNGGLWVTAGFIVGFDSDDEAIFRRQIQFIERAAIPFASISLLQAPPTTPLYDRMHAQGRLLDNDSIMSFGGDCSLPNFQTVMESDTLFKGAAGIMLELYDPEKYFERGLRSLEHWVPKPIQRGPRVALVYGLRAVLRSMWVQGVRADYRRPYWRYFGRLLWRWWRDPPRLTVALNVLVMAHHFLGHAREVATELHDASREICARRAAGRSLIEAPPIPS